MEQFFAKCAEEGHTILTSPLFVIEVRNHTYLKDNEVIPELKSYGLVVEHFDTDEQSIRKRIRQLKGLEDEFKKAGTEYWDKVHIALALESGCEAIITWNKKHFEPAEKLIRVFTPADFT